MNIALFYFSATGNTARIAQILKKALLKLEHSVNCFDLTKFELRMDYIENLKMNSFDGIIIGSPVYAYRTPNFIRDWLEQLNGQNTLTALFFTYGGVSPGVVHDDTIHILHEQNFNVIATAEFLGSHSFNLAGWDLLKNRPEKRDFKIVRNYAKLIVERFQTKNKTYTLEVDASSLGENTLKKIEERAMNALNPPKFLDTCNLCKICENYCPTNAINIRKYSIDEKRCIRCLKCVKICPINALKVQNISRLLKFLKKAENLNEKTLNRKESKIFL